MKKEKNNKKKSLLALLLLVGSAAIIFGTVYAFFSDVIEGEEKTATAGTLTISATEGTITQNGGTYDEDNINPGDFIVIPVTVTATGTKSAWARATIEINDDEFTAGAIKVFDGNVNAANLGTATLATETSLNSGVYATSTQILAGSVENDLALEAAITAPKTSATTMVVYYTVYFDKAAGNANQGKILKFTINGEALQYRNNTVQANLDWTSVEPAN